ncbi:glycosyltransferase [Oscillatoria amoena NRMC-F 0135]|nr:glycosyltransferase [Oscillatoria laete-virens]MDL5051032.1 glycosyltransferase [Oscillatoria amoena NRMC-F 0135]MDL5054483.1 glycosyltransferase [Oscillatoria laete-virens NRMC-F 0139]
MVTFVLPEKYETQRVHCGVEAIRAEALSRGLAHRVIHAPEDEMMREKPGLIMISFKQYFKNLGVFSRWFGQLRKKGWVISIYHIDAPWNNGLSEFRWKIIKNLFWPFDIFFTHAVEDDAPKTASVVYLPNACGVELIDVTVDTPEIDIGFCGNFKPQNKEHAKRIRLLEEYGQAFQKAGIRFVTRQDDGKMDTWLDHARACWLQLSIGSAADKPDRMSHGLPARVYGFSCVGALTIIEPRRHLADDFTDEGELPVYESPEDCVDTVRKLLADKDALNDRRRKLLAHSRQRHLYSHRLDKVLEAARASGLSLST